MKPSELLEKLSGQPPKRIAVVAAQDDRVLEALAQAYREGIALPVLCGDIEAIDEAARRSRVDLSPFEIVETDHDAQSAAVAVSLVRSGRADILMKGHLQTAELLRAVLGEENGLRRADGGLLSHVGILYSAAQKRTWFLTDCVMVMRPGLEEKAALIRNAVAAAKGLGVALPKVAPLAAVELVNPAMEATADAAQLTVMNRRGQIADCLVDGPLAFDLAVSPEAAQQKGIVSPVAGQADILLFPDLEAGNATLKAMTLLGGCVMGGVVMGARAPIVLASRSDSAISKLYSIACACAIGDVQHGNRT